MTTIVLAILAVFFGLLDNCKYLLQAKKIRKFNKPKSVSKRFLLISIVTRLFLVMYSLYVGYWVFVTIYFIGLFTTFNAYWILYTKYRDNSNWSFGKYFLKSFK